MPISCISGSVALQELQGQKHCVRTDCIHRGMLIPLLLICLKYEGVQVFTRFLGNVLMYVQHRAMLFKVASGRVDVR